MKLYSKFIATMLLSCVMSLPALAADDAKPIDVIDFLVDAGDLIGKTVTVTGCKFKMASTNGIYCSAGVPGNFMIDAATLEKEDLRKALKTCASLGDSPVCTGNVSGIVSVQHGITKLKQAKIHWSQ